MVVLYVADVMNPSVITISNEATLADAVARMLERRISALVVIDHAEHMVGVISQTDLLRALQEGDNLETIRRRSVSDYMTREVVSCAPYKPLAYAMGLLREHRIHRLVVVETRDGGRFVTDRMKPVGILSQTDIVRSLAGRREDEYAVDVVDELPMLH